MELGNLHFVGEWSAWAGEKIEHGGLLSPTRKGKTYNISPHMATAGALLALSDTRDIRCVKV